MAELLALAYLLAALSGGIVGSISLPIVMSRSVMFALTLLHSILGGAILGVYLNTVLRLGLPIPLIAALTAVGFSILTAELVEKGMSEDVATALSVATATTITIVFSYLASHVSSTAISTAWGYVMGVSAIATEWDITMAAIALIIVAPTIHLTMKEFRYIAFDEEGARSLGLNVRFYRYLFYSLVSAASAVLSSTIGVLVTHVVLAVPGALALRIGRGHTVVAYSSSLAVILLGYFLARVLGVPPSGGVGVVSVSVIIGMLMYERG